MRAIALLLCVPMLAWADGSDLPRDAGAPVRIELARPNPLPSLVDEALRGEDPGKDNWETEALNQAVERRLRVLGQWIEDPGSADLERISESISDGFSCDSLRPPNLSLAFRDEILSIHRPVAASSPTHRGVEGLAEAIRLLRKGLGAGGAVRVDFEVYRIESGKGFFTTRVSYEASRRSPDGGIQQYADWLMRWEGSLETVDAIRLQRIERLDYEEATIRLPGGALYADCTESALRNTPAFRDQVQRGLMHWAERISSLESLSMFGHAGLAVGDVNGDGLEDLYVCAEGGLPNRLYTQQEDGTLNDVSAWAGVDWLEPSLNALLVDLDNDGDQDLVVATLPSLLFAENNGQGQFELRTRLTVAREAYALTAADYDNDGDIDLYITAYGGLGPGTQGDSSGGAVQSGGHTGGHAAATVFDPMDDDLPADEDAPATGTSLPVPYHDANNGGRNVLLRNEGQLRFEDATEESGVDRNNRRFSFAAAWEDYDNDGDLDLYVANDFGRNNLYRNTEGHFIDVAAAAGVEDVGAGMSVSWGDYNRDGWMDLYVGNMYSSAGNRVAYQREFAGGESARDVAALRRTARGNTLFTNESAGGFRDDSEVAATTNGRWAWSSNFADLNNDGLLDLVVANGFLTGELPDDL